MHAINISLGYTSFLKLINFNWKIITILWWFLLYIDVTQPRVHMCPPILTPLPPASATALSALPHSIYLLKIECLT